MRTVAARLMLVLGVAAGAPEHAYAQRAISDAVPRAAVPAPLLTLRPSPSLRALAIEAAEVLELRTGQRVEIGEPPPPDIVEAVPAGHVALVYDDSGKVAIVLGAAGGLSHDTVVRLGGERGERVDARAVALAVEALRDLAMELSVAGGAAPSLPPVVPAAEAAPVPWPQADDARTQRSAEAVTEPSVSAHAPPEPTRNRRDPRTPRDDLGDRWVVGGFLSEVEPLAYVRAYSGASLASGGPQLGVGTGLGLCVLRQCLVVFGEVPMTLGARDPLDTRYAYPTFGSSFYARPFSFGSLTPGASLGFVTRVGRFEQDMGLPSQGLRTDLGARGTLEVAYELWRGLDLLSEVGADLMLDRLRLSDSGRMATRGDRWSPWAQVSVRYSL